MAKPRKGRPRGVPANHHLKLEGGTWIFRLARGGRDRVKSTGCPKSEIAAARRIRDRLLGEYASKAAGVEEIPEAVTEGRMIALYIAAESNFYDRERGGKQHGAKRAADADRVIVDRLRRAGLDFDLPADRLDKEMLFDLSSSLARMGLAGLTRRNTLRFLRAAYAWARRNKKKTGVLVNPFDDLDQQERARLFPKEIARKAPPFKRVELRALYGVLPAHVLRPVRFAAHTGMRWGSDLLRMTWGRVDFDRRVYTVDPRWAKRGKERDVPLSEAALSVLQQIRPMSPSPDAPVWLNSRDNPLRDVRDIYESAVREVCPAPRPGWRYPDFHSLRRTCATALAQVAPKAIVSAVLGHAKEDVTDDYIDISIEAEIAALDRAALLIDGEVTDNVVPIAGEVDRRAVRTA